MSVQNLIAQCEALGVTLAPGPNGTLLVSPPGVLPQGLREQLRTNKQDLVRILTAAPADFLSDEPCPTCGSRERWQWLDGRMLCRVCLVLDLTPMTLASAMKEGMRGASQ